MTGAARMQTGAGADTAADESGWVARFDRLLSRQVELCQQLAKLSERQRDFIDGSDPDALLGVLSERQGVIDRLRSASEEAAPLRERWSSRAAAGVEREGGAALLASVRSRINELTGLMREIASRDAEDRLRLDKARDALAGRLAGVARSRGAIAAYGGPKGAAPRFQDREG